MRAPRACTALPGVTDLEAPSGATADVPHTWANSVWGRLDPQEPVPAKPDLRYRTGEREVFAYVVRSRSGSEPSIPLGVEDVTTGGSSAIVVAQAGTGSSVPMWMVDVYIKLDGIHAYPHSPGGVLVDN